MKMARIEKRFVNAAGHSRRVARAAVARLRAVPCCAGQTYLDVGCGNGAAALRVHAEHGLDVTGIDVDPEQIRLARTAAGGRPGVRFLAGDATRLPFDDALFDIVASNNATHHIADWKAALGEMVRVLRPGGYVVYGDVVLPGWLTKPARSIFGGHVGFLTRRDLARFLATRDLRIVHESARIVRYDVIGRRADGPR